MDSAMLVLRVLLALTCVVGLIWYLGRRLGGGRPQRSSREHTVTLVSRQAVGRHTGVAVVAVGNRRLLLGYGDQQVTLLTELGPVVDLPADPSVAQPGPARDWVSSALARTRGVPAPHAAPDAAFVTDAAPGEPAAHDDLAADGRSALQGSILAPDTWRQAVRTLQDRTVRR
ncbi:FliO/MopB family protein [Cellulomonas fengjieae]|uniref:FliO/MopB family protein n=1 Tax=Cellulomonas fengjieae TaxID=2819978 RepID=UPI001AAE1934|nr:flagellar biosynthetic protein FliO [Cellulomonas fengjieae]MBO3100670.1 flagellar biosynthetic protein FliO [Cellulomonas fengjieae]